jgi:hypothetical protein
MKANSKSESAKSEGTPKLEVRIALRIISEIEGRARLSQRAAATFHSDGALGQMRPTFHRGGFRISI